MIYDRNKQDLNTNHVVTLAWFHYLPGLELTEYHFPF
jgi:hypothetical protein